MDYKGYAGSVLRVDLSSNEVSKDPLSLDAARDFIGGFGLNNALAYDNGRPGADPLGPENTIVLGAGPLIGTLAPGSSRVVGTTRLPLSRAVGAGSGSMTFGIMLKRAGYDHVIITGRADRPKYLLIDDDGARLEDATHLWGKDIYQTTDALWEKHGRCGTIAIGPAGENQVKFALAMIDKIATLGRGGFGAVMGSKNLKAILACGTGGISVADPGRFMRIIDGLYQRARKYPLHGACIELGLMAHGNYALNEEGPFGLKTYRRLKKDRLACPSCFIADKDLLEIKEGEFAGLNTYTHSFAVAAGTAQRFGIEDTPRAIRLVNMLNRYGLGDMEFARIADLLLELQHEGTLTQKDTDGFRLERNFEGIAGLIEMITSREGIGDVLADGWMEAAEKLGLDPQRHSLHIKGFSSRFDPRGKGLGTMEFEQIVNPRGGHHQSGGSPSYNPGVPLEQFERHCDRMGASQDAMERIFDSPLEFDVGRMTRYAEDWFALLNSLGICIRHHNNRFYSAQICADLYSAATGIELDRNEIMRSAERAWNMYKVLNVREGFSRKDDTFPEKWFEPLQFGGTELRLTDYYGKKVLAREDLERLLDNYYDERDWDRQRGIPTREKLRELGLDKVVRDLTESCLL